LIDRAKWVREGMRQQELDTRSEVRTWWLGVERSARPSLATTSTISRRHIVAAVIGNGLEFYDFLTYAYFAVAIGKAFFPNDSPIKSLLASLATFGIGFVFRPLGAFVFGVYADSVGRRPAMVLSFALMGLSMLSMALIPSYTEIGVAAPIMLIITRIVQGFALGGEIGPTAAFLVEAAPPRMRGLYTAFQNASLGVAQVICGCIGILLSLTLNAATMEHYGWRIAFLLGAVTLPFGVLMRRALPETVHGEDHLPTHTPRIASISVLRSHFRVIALAFIVFASLTTSSYVTIYMATYSRTFLHMDALSSFAVTVVASLVALPLGLIGAIYSDRWGRKPIILTSRALFILLIYPVFFIIIQERTPLVLIVGYAMLAAATFGNPTVSALAVESLPKEIRGQGFGLIYALTSIVGGSTQFVITSLIDRTGSNFAPAYYLIATSTIGFLAMLGLRETAPVRIHGREALAISMPVAVAGGPSHANGAE
jgi:MFS transporter, MHS family, citrate/tricarballylate:H+ symporter